MLAAHVTSAASILIRSPTLESVAEVYSVGVPATIIVGIR